MPTPSPTVSELVATLGSSNLTTILAEGTHDAQIYRWIETRLLPLKADVLACGGRSNLLTLFERRREFGHIKTVFIADQNMWLFSSIPDKYQEGILWTVGYSIENDLYAGARLEDLLDNDELEDFKQVISCICEWFAFEVDEYREGRPANVDVHPLQVVPLGTNSICEQFVATRGFAKPSGDIIHEVLSEYKLKLRGKLLFNLLASRYLNNPNRYAKFSNSALQEIAYKATQDHYFMNRFINDIQTQLTNI